jgi:hypothetical protein
VRIHSPMDFPIKNTQFHSDSEEIGSNEGTDRRCRKQRDEPSSSNDRRKKNEPHAGPCQHKWKLFQMTGGARARDRSWSRIRGRSMTAKRGGGGTFHWRSVGDVWVRQHPDVELGFWVLGFGGISHHRP